MASTRNIVFRPIHLQDAELLMRARAIIEQSRALLAHPVPSTFLGARQTPSPDKADAQEAKGAFS